MDASAECATTNGVQPSDELALWQKFMLHEDRLTNITEPPEVDNMASTKVSQSVAKDTLTEEEQEQTVGAMPIRASSMLT